MSEVVTGELENALSVIKDPFNSDCLDSLFISASKGIFTKEWLYNARVKFINGNTVGEQVFKEDNLDAVIKKVAEFLKEMGKE